MSSKRYSLASHPDAGARRPAPNRMVFDYENSVLHTSPNPKNNSWKKFLWITQD